MSTSGGERMQPRAPEEPDETACLRLSAIGRNASPTLAMQKVVGSSPIIRSTTKAAFCAAFVVLAFFRFLAASCTQVRSQVRSRIALGCSGEHCGVPVGRFSEVVGVDAHRHVRVRVAGRSRWYRRASAPTSRTGRGDRPDYPDPASFLEQMLARTSPDLATCPHTRSRRSPRQPERSRTRSHSLAPHRNP